MQTRRQAAQSDRAPPPPPRPLPAGIRPRRGGTLVSPRGSNADAPARNQVAREFDYVEVQAEDTPAPPQARQPPPQRALPAENPPQPDAPQRVDRATQADEVPLQEQEQPPEAAIIHSEQSCQTDPSRDWILRVRLPPPLPPPRPRRPQDPPIRVPKQGPIVSIHIPAYMSVDTLSACLLQAVLHHPSAASSSMPVLDTRENRFVGLFAERSGIFFSLDHILSSLLTEERKQIFCTHLPPPPPPLPPAPTPWYLKWQFWLIVSLPFLIHVIYDNIELIVDTAVASSIWVYHAVIQIPLQEMYRHGPWFIGWEGGSLPEICSRITYHGDEAFWYRNMVECERIFAAKEEAWLRLARPFLWGVLFFMAVVCIRFIIWEFFTKPPPPPPPPPMDRDMVDTYRAWQTLLRQVQRTWAPTPPALPARGSSRQENQPLNGTRTAGRATAMR